MKYGIFIASLAVIGTVVLASVAFLLRTDGQMVFPKSSHGTFILAPELVVDGENRYGGGYRGVTWILPEKCSRSSYEFQEVGYKADSGMLWGGVDASCTLIDVGYECFAELHPEMNGRDTQWTIQASAHDCDGGDYYISDATLTNTF